MLKFEPYASSLGRVCGPRSRTCKIVVSKLTRGYGLPMRLPAEFTLPNRNSDGTIRVPMAKS